MKKIVKFTPQLSKLIINGKKNSTWRLFDYKDLRVDDEIILATRDGDTVTHFGEAKITKLTVKTIGTIDSSDYDNSHKPSIKLLEEYREIYGAKVQLDTEVKIINFEIRKFY